MENIKNELMEKLELPSDVIRQECIVQINGNREMVIGNLKGIQLFTSEKIVVLTKQGILTVEGSRLMIEFYNNEEMKISGKFTLIGFGG